MPNEVCKYNLLIAHLEGLYPVYTMVTYKRYKSIMNMVMIFTVKSFLFPEKQGLFYVCSLSL